MPQGYIYKIAKLRLIIQKLFIPLKKIICNFSIKQVVKIVRMKHPRDLFGPDSVHPERFQFDRGGQLKECKDWAGYQFQMKDFMIQRHVRNGWKRIRLYLTFLTTKFVIILNCKVISQHI